MRNSCCMSELHCIGIAVCRSCGVWELRVKVVMWLHYSWGSCGVGELQCEGVAVSVRKLWCV